MRSLLATRTLKATGFVSVRHHKTRRGNMNKQDKKFIAALVFMQTGILLCGISLSGHYWHHSFVRLMKIQHLYELSEHLKGRVNEVQSDIKMNTLKNQYEKKGIGVGEH